ncbi:hypothetical protein LJC56_00325 [Christensenellaceae bacterium OttesenSCG-928-K19]|nr:hypothetical protein [Christensenellaceae bacterium OttesenSCG-928-K19]
MYNKIMMGLALENKENLAFQIIALALLVCGIVYYVYLLYTRWQVVKHGEVYMARKVGFLRPQGSYVWFRFNRIQRTTVKPLYEIETEESIYCTKSFDTYRPSPPPYREDEQKNWISPYVTRLYDEVYFYEKKPKWVSVAGKKFVRRYVVWLLVFCALVPVVFTLPGVWPKSPTRQYYDASQLPTQEELYNLILQDHEEWESFPVVDE